MVYHIWNHSLLGVCLLSHVHRIMNIVKRMNDYKDVTVLLYKGVSKSSKTEPID